MSRAFITFFKSFFFFPERAEMPTSIIWQYSLVSYLLDFSYYICYNIIIRYKGA